MANYDEIIKMWAQAYSVMVAPQGFRKACEDYIRDTLHNVLRTEVLFAKHKTNFGEVTAIRVNVLAKVEVVVSGSDQPRTLYELDEDGDVHDVAQFVFNYVQGEDFSTIKEWNNENGSVSPYRVVGGLVVKPLASLEGECRLEDGVLYVSQNDFYKDVADYLLEMVSFDVDNIRKLYESAIDPKSRVEEEVFRRVAGEYLRREMWQNTLQGYIEFPCDEKAFEVHSVPKDLSEEVTFEEAQLDKIREGNGDDVLFDFSNEREESIDEIDCGYLWCIVSSIEYKKHPHREQLMEMAKGIEVTAPVGYADMAKEFVHHVIFDKMHSSRWSLWNEDLYFTILDKNNEPVGLLADIVCKGESVKVELRQAMTLPYPTCTGLLDRIDFEDLSPISMAHLVAYVGLAERNVVFSNLRHFEEDGVRVPYRMRNGRVMSHLGIREDYGMTDIAEKNEAVLSASPVVFYCNDYEKQIDAAKNAWR